MAPSRHAGRWRLAVLATGLSLSAACGQDAVPGVATPGASVTTDSATGGPTTTTGTPAQACPLVDPTVLRANFDVQRPELAEKEPVKTGPATTYACDISDAGELFLTAGVSVGPLSGTAEANLRAALSNNEGEPVEGLGEVGGYNELAGVATAAGVKRVGSQWMVVFVHGAAGNKDRLVAVAQDVARKV